VEGSGGIRARISELLVSAENGHKASSQFST